MADTNVNQSNQDKKDEEKVALTNEEAEPDTINDSVSSKAKFINGGADYDQVKVDVEDPSEASREFVGLTKDELMQYANDPYWIKCRWVMLILFWVAWVGMLVAAIVIIVLAPKCPPRPNLEWWQKSVAYKIEPRSLQDTDADGNGDLKGISDHLEYFQNRLNASTLWLGPVYASPMKNSGYDISDFKEIDPMFGTMADFDNLRISMHKRNMKLILDFVPNHSSSEHPWFVESKKSNANDNKYRDYYIWHKGVNGGPPNNWLNKYGKSAWTLDATRNEYYFHQYLPDQPDLNLRNPKVQEEIKSVLSFWLDKKVDGFRIHGLAELFESENITDNEPQSSKTNPPNPYDSLDHTLTLFQPETYDILEDWRSLLTTYTELAGYKFLMADVTGSANQTMEFYNKGLDMVMNNELKQMKKGCDAVCISELVSNWMEVMPSGKWTNWALGGSHDSRIATKLQGEQLDLANMLLLLLPGTPITYYGEEIGMENIAITVENNKDFVVNYTGGDLAKSANAAQSPMQWTYEKPNAGFTVEGVKPWLPVNPNFDNKNVETQTASGAGHTTIEVYGTFSVLRKEPSFQWGTFTEVPIVGNSLYAFVRQAQGFPGYLVVMNFGAASQTANFHALKPNLIPEEGTVAGHTGNFNHGDFETGNTVSLANIHLSPGEGVVFNWEAGAAETKEE